MTATKATAPDIGSPSTATAPARIVWRNQYDYQRDAAERALTDAVNTEPSMTLQSPSEDADLNVVLKRYGIRDGSKLPGMHLSQVDPTYYGDFTNATDLKSALNAMLEAENRFMELPAELRARFNNDWIQLHDWVNDPSHTQEAVQLGMLTAPVQPTPTTPPAAVPPTPAT